jgi:hypothetical protein
VYPGDAQCRLSSPHAIWHEESAIGLLEIMFFADKLNEIFTTATYGKLIYNMDEIENDL